MSCTSCTSTNQKSQRSSLRPLANPALEQIGTGAGHPGHEWDAGHAPGGACLTQPRGPHHHRTELNVSHRETEKLLYITANDCQWCKCVRTRIIHPKRWWLLSNAAPFSFYAILVPSQLYVPCLGLLNLILFAVTI